MLPKGKKERKENRKEKRENFYQSLYQSQLSIDQDIHDGDIFFNLNNIPTLANDKQALCEGLITESEAFNALKDFSADKTPGTDRLPAEFLKYFGPQLQSSIVSSFKHAFQNGCLLISPRRGIISLIPKKNKDKTILENLRPISLLNVDRSELRGASISHKKPMSQPLRVSFYF